MRALSVLAEAVIGASPGCAWACMHVLSRAVRFVGRAVALGVLGAGIAFGASNFLGFSRSVTPGLVKHFASLFGDSARGRLAGWQNFVRPLNENRPQARSTPNDRDLLDLVNTYFNRTPFVADIDHWKVEDYWASPAEMLSSNGGDCEDFSIAKYFTLKELGVPVERLRITYVKAIKLNQAHMVLAYYATPGAEPLILDNLEARVRPAGERTDLIPVYSFNDEDLILVQQGSSGARRGSPTQIRLWNALQDKLERELRM